MSDLRLVALNLHAGAGPGRDAARHAMNLMDDEDADGGIWTEAKVAVRFLRRFKVLVLGEDPKPRRNGEPLPEQGDTVITLNMRKVRRWWIAVQKLRWVVRKYNRWHDPRRDVVAMLRGPVKGIRAMHLPPGGPGDARNGKAWRAQMDDALQWAGRRGCRVLVGDFNGNALTILAYAQKRGYDLDVAGVGVDLCAVTHGTVKAKNLGKPSDDYDHPAVRFDITADRDELRRLRRIWRNRK